VWMSERMEKLSGALLADEMGLGKTIQTIAIEIKASTSPKPSKGFWNAVEDIKASKKYIIAPVSETYPIQKGLIVTNVFSFLKKFK